MLALASCLVLCLPRLVRLAVGAGHGIDVGQVGGDDVQALALRTGRAAGNVKDLEHAHLTDFSSADP